MTLQTLTLEKIHEICKSPAGQAEIAKFAHEMNSQGVTKMFIDYAKLRNVVQRMTQEGLLRGYPFSEYSSDENYNRSFISYCTDKIIEFLSMVQDIEQMPVEDGLPMLSKLTTFYLLNPMAPMKVFYWMSEYAIFYKNLYEKLIDYYFSYIDRNCDKWAMYKELLNEAIPLGVNSEIKAFSWVRENANNYAKLDFSEILDNIPFERYYFEAFECNSVDRDTCNQENEFNKFKFVSKSQIKHLVDEHFKVLVLDEVFRTVKNISVQDINVEMRRVFEKKPTLFYMLYSRAMFAVEASETQRIQRELLKYFDDNGIEYKLTYNQSVDPRMFEDTPWSGNFC